VTVSETMTTTTQLATATTTTAVTAKGLCAAVSKTVGDNKFATEHAGNSRAPLAMIAFALAVVERILRNKEINAQCHFDGISMTVPATNNAYYNPHCHSIVGQKLLYVDWIKMYGLEITCPPKKEFWQMTGPTFPRTRFFFLCLCWMDLLFGAW